MYMHKTVFIFFATPIALTKRKKLVKKYNGINFFISSSKKKNHFQQTFL